MEAQRHVFGDSRVKGETKVDVAEENDPMKKMRIGEVSRREKGMPIYCDCGVVVALKTSMSPNNRGERVFRCGYDIYGGGECCGFRRWWEDVLLFGKIKQEKRVMQHRLEEANKRIDKQEGRIYEMQMQYVEVMEDRNQLDDYDGELCGMQLGLADMRDKHSTLERMFEFSEMKYQNLNKYL